MIPQPGKVLQKFLNYKLCLDPTFRSLECLTTPTMTPVGSPVFEDYSQYRDSQGTTEFRYEIFSVPAAPGPPPVQMPKDLYQNNFSAPPSRRSSCSLAFLETFCETLLQRSASRFLPSPSNRLQCLRSSFLRLQHSLLASTLRRFSGKTDSLLLLLLLVSRSRSRI